jgi:hypothetical protein
MKAREAERTRIWMADGAFVLTVSDLDEDNLKATSGSDWLDV